MSDVVCKVWGFCHAVRHDGIDYGDYIEQITYLLFINMADERGVELPKGCSWPELEAESGTALTDHYADVLRTLGKQTGILGDIFAQSMPRFNNPVNLKKLISLIDETEWTSLDKDVKAEAFEGLLPPAQRLRAGAAGGGVPSHLLRHAPPLAARLGHAHGGLVMSDLTWILDRLKQGDRHGCTPVVVAAEW